MIWSVNVTFEALDREAAEGERKRIEWLLAEVSLFEISEVAEVAPLVTDNDLPEDYWETAQ